MLKDKLLGLINKIKSTTKISDQLDQLAEFDTMFSSVVAGGDVAQEINNTLTPEQRKKALDQVWKKTSKDLRGGKGNDRSIMVNGSYLDKKEAGSTTAILKNLSDTEIARLLDTTVGELNGSVAGFDFSKAAAVPSGNEVDNAILDLESNDKRVHAQKIVDALAGNGNATANAIKSIISDDYKKFGMYSPKTTVFAPALQLLIDHKVTDTETLKCSLTDIKTFGGLPVDSRQARQAREQALEQKKKLVALIDKAVKKKADSDVSTAVNAVIEQLPLFQFVDNSDIQRSKSIIETLKKAKSGTKTEAIEALYIARSVNSFDPISFDNHIKFAKAGEPSKTTTQDASQRLENTDTDITDRLNELGAIVSISNSQKIYSLSGDKVNDIIALKKIGDSRGYRYELGSETLLKSEYNEFTAEAAGKSAITYNVNTDKFSSDPHVPAKTLKMALAIINDKNYQRTETGSDGVKTVLFETTNGNVATLEKNQDGEIVFKPKKGVEFALLRPHQLVLHTINDKAVRGLVYDRGAGASHGFVGVKVDHLKTVNDFINSSDETGTTTDNNALFEKYLAGGFNGESATDFKQTMHNVSDQGLPFDSLKDGVISWFTANEDQISA